MGKTVCSKKEHTEFSYAVYDMNKKRVVRTKKFSFKSYYFDKSKAAYGLQRMDDKYMYFVKSAGTITNKKGKITDGRKRYVLVYDYNGKLVNSIDYTKYLTQYGTKPGISYIKRTESSIDVKDGYVYILTGTGIYKCNNQKKNLQKLYDIEKPKMGLPETARTVEDFCYMGSGKFAYIAARNDDGESNYLNVVSTEQ